MTQQPFCRPGAIDLSGLKRPAAASRRRRPPARRWLHSAASGSAYALDVDEQNFQYVLEASMTAPVVLVFYSPSQAPESARWPRRGDGRQRVRRPLPGRPDRHRRLARHRPGDADPAGADALRAARRAAGRAADPGPDPAGRAAGAVQPARPAAHRAGHHGPPPAALCRRPPARPTTSRSRWPTRATPPPRTPSARATSTGRWPSTRSWSTATPPTPRPPPGLAMAKVLQRTQGVDLQAARDGGCGQPRRRRRPDAGGRPRHARWPRRGRVQPAGRPRAAHRRTTTATGPASTCSACSPPWATTTHGCSRRAGTWRQRCSERRPGRACEGR